MQSVSLHLLLITTDGNDATKEEQRDIQKSADAVVKEGADIRIADGATVTVDPVDPKFKVDYRREGGGGVPHTLPGKSQRRSACSGKTKREKQKHEIENSNRPYRGMRYG